MEKAEKAAEKAAREEAREVEKAEKAAEKAAVHQAAREAAREARAAQKAQKAAARDAPRGEPQLDLTADEAREIAVLEGLELVPAANKTGFSCVKPNKSKYKAEVSVLGIDVSLGTFATAQEAALHVARHKAKAVAEAAAAAGSGSTRKRPAEAPPKSMATISGSEHLVKAPRHE